MKKIKNLAVFVFFLLLGINVSYWAEITYSNPTWADISSAWVNNDCIDADLIGNDETDNDTTDNTHAEVFCELLSSTLVSYQMDEGAADPDVCELSINNATISTAWRFDTTAVNNYTSIVCENWITPWCTDNAANNYNPNANQDNWSCTYDPATWTWWTWTWATNVYVNINWWDWINKEVFTEEFIKEFFEIQAIWMAILVFLRFFYRLITWVRRKKILGI